MLRYLIYHPRYVCLVRLAQITCAPPLSNLNIEVLRLFLSVSSGHLSTGTHMHHMENPCLIWSALTQNQTLTTLEVGQCMP